MYKSKLFFDTEHGPSAAEIRKNYRNCLDLTTYKNLTHGDVADAVLETASRDSWRLKIPSYAPEEPGRYLFWDKEEQIYARGGKRYVPLDTPGRFNKFGPEINLTKRSTTMKELVEDRLTPKKLMKVYMESKENRELMSEGSWRGLGWWDPVSHEHKLLPMDVMIEGEKFAKDYGKEVVFNHQHGDTFVSNVPSLTRKDRKYGVIIRMLPVTAENDAFCQEWTRTESFIASEDFYHRTAGGKKKEGDEYAGLYKFSNKERTFSLHTWGCLLLAAERSRKDGSIKKILIDYPVTNKSSMWNVWYALGNKTTVAGYDGSEERPDKTEARVILPWVVSKLGGNAAFDLTE
jgi:hypothetical protein